jgi:holo-[acyl-carrier protein] synthase
MILGIGTDLVDIRRIERTLARHGERFIQRVFTQAEQERCEARPNLRIASYAKRFAAKEACAKALGTGIRGPVTLRSIGVVNDAAGKPGILLSEGARDLAISLAPSGYEPQIHLALSDDFPMAQAFVVISATKIGL